MTLGSRPVRVYWNAADKTASGGGHFVQGAPAAVSWRSGVSAWDEGIRLDVKDLINMNETVHSGFTVCIPE